MLDIILSGIMPDTTFKKSHYPAICWTPVYIKVTVWLFMGFLCDLYLNHPINVTIDILDTNPLLSLAGVDIFGQKSKNLFQNFIEILLSLFIVWYIFVLTTVANWSLKRVYLSTEM